MQSVLWGLELYKADLLKRRHFSRSKTKLLPYFELIELLVSGGQEFQLAVGFSKPGPPGRCFYGLQDVENILLLHFCREENAPISSSVFFFHSLSLLLLFFLFHEISTRWEENGLYHQFHDLSSIIENDSYLLFHMLIPLTNVCQACMSNTLPGTRQSESNRHRNPKSSCI